MIGLVAALGLVLSPLYQAKESLADKAARARRTAAPASDHANPPKVYTNEDLLNAKGTVIVVPEPAGEPEAAPEAETAAKTPGPEPTEEEQRAKAGAALQHKIDEQAEIIRQNQKLIDDSQRQLGDLTEYTFGPRRADLMQRVETAQQSIEAAKRAIDDVEEQARRQGIRVSRP